MKDLFKKYNRQKLLEHSSILGLALVLSVGINLFVLDGSTGAALKANVLEASSEYRSQTDLYSQYKDNSLSIYTAEGMSSATELSLTLAYDPEIVIGDIKSSYGANLEIISNASGFTTLIISLDTPFDINKNSELFSVTFEKKLEDSANIVNIIQANFKDSSGESYSLSAKNIIF